MFVFGMTAVVGCSREESVEEEPVGSAHSRDVQQVRANRIRQALEKGKARKSKSEKEDLTPVQKKVLPQVVPEEGDAEYQALPPVERQTLQEVQVALDEDDYEKTVVALQKVSVSSSPLVRRRAAEALGWFGKKALPDVVMFLADSDEDVRSTAQASVEQSINEMESEAEKVAAIERLMMIRGACDEDTLVMLAGELNGIFDETLTVAAASRVIEAGVNPEGVSAMKEVYEFVTGEEYSGAEAANQWIESTREEQMANED